ncbi:MAG: hypothetical protein QOK10_3817, partial [Pseudonocardiales bacterium]|nr:hypothetical protein [Pseudonocardiales bacterium]
MAIFRRIRLALLALSLVLASGTVGYVLPGFGLLDAVYQNGHHSHDRRPPPGEARAVALAFFT